MRLVRKWKFKCEIWHEFSFFRLCRCNEYKYSNTLTASASNIRYNRIVGLTYILLECTTSLKLFTLQDEDVL